MITIIGSGPGSAGCLTEDAALAIKSSRVLVGGKRILDMVCPPGARRIDLPDGMAEAVTEVLERESAKGDVSLVVSGDPGFYSLAKKVVARFGRREVSIIPGISSIQIMAARLCRSWAGVLSTTIHGRARPPIAELEGKLASAPALVVLMGKPDDVGSLLEWMASSEDLASARAAIGWDLGLPDERVLEFESLSALESDPYRGRLALLWLEKHDVARDA